MEDCLRKCMNRKGQCNRKRKNCGKAENCIPSERPVGDCNSCFKSCCCIMDMEESDGGQSAPTAVIVASVLGTALVFVIAVSMAYCYYIRKKKRLQERPAVHVNGEDSLKNLAQDSSQISNHFKDENEEYETIDELQARDVSVPSDTAVNKYSHIPLPSLPERQKNQESDTRTATAPLDNGYSHLASKTIFQRETTEQNGLVNYSSMSNEDQEISKYNAGQHANDSEMDDFSDMPQSKKGDHSDGYFVLEKDCPDSQSLALETTDKDTLGSHNSTYSILEKPTKNSQHSTYCVLEKDALGPQTSEYSALEKNSEYFVLETDTIGSHTDTKSTSNFGNSILKDTGDAKNLSENRGLQEDTGESQTHEYSILERADILGSKNSRCDKSKTDTNSSTNSENGTSEDIRGPRTPEYSLFENDTQLAQTPQNFEGILSDTDTGTS